MIKRIIDIFLALSALLLTLPLLIVLTILVAVKLGHPVLFSQLRPGLNGKTFRLYKFRSMTDERDAEGNHLEDSQRLTSFGKTLRSLSLDELPSLLNVLKGDMSLVGPRPLLVEYLPIYSEEQSRRHNVRPGITGWAQVNGRNAISWEKKFKFDVWYVENQSIWLDIKILFMTVKQVFVREGISAKGETTMLAFIGLKYGRNKQDED